MAERRRRDLAPDKNEGLNEGLSELRALDIPEKTAMKGLFSAVERIKGDFESAVVSGEPRERTPSGPDELRAAADALPAILERRASFGSKAHQFVDNLHNLITTRADGTPITGSINPSDRGGSDPEKAYLGDDREVPRLYVASEGMRGRVVDTMWLTAEAPGLWLWPDNISEWNGHGWTGSGYGGPQHMFLLEDSVEFVEHVSGCKLPALEDYSPSYGHASL